MNEVTPTLSRRFKRESRYIASVYPDQLIPIERPFDGWHIYDIDPCPRGAAPSVLEVQDCFQVEVDPLQRDKKIEVIIFAEQVVADLLNHWSRTPIGAPPGCGPGVGEIQGPEPTETELRLLLGRQQVMFEFLYHEGMRLGQNEDWRDITRHHRLAAQYLDKEETWARDLRNDKKVIPCPACFAPIDARAFICPHCSITVRALPAALLAIQPGGAGYPDLGGDPDSDPATPRRGRGKQAA